MTADAGGPSWRRELPSDDLGTFEWDVSSDRWSWSEEMFAIHGYAPGGAAVSTDLVLAHKLPADRGRAERLFGDAATLGFRFRNLHAIVDTRGRERVVLSVGATEPVSAADGSQRAVVRGFMADLTGLRREVLQRFARLPADPVPYLPASGPITGADAGPQLALSERERQVLALVGAGYSNAEIAEQLFVSVNTVKTYVRTAYRKIGVRRRSQAVLWSAEQAERARER